jgi:membrane-bound ClpP family serine protease
MWRSCTGGAVADEAAVGKVGEVVVRVRGEDGPGEIVTIVRGMRERFIAYSETPIDRGQRVLVLSVRGPRTVNVMAWNE